MRTNSNFERHSVYLREGDWDTIRAHFPELSPTAVTRRLIAKFVDSLRQETKVDGLQEEMRDV